VPSSAIAHEPQHSRAVTCQVFIVPDGSPLGLADKSCDPSLALDQRQVAQVVAVMLDQVEGEQHCLTATSLAPQRAEVRRPVVAGDHRLTVDQGTIALEASGGFDNGRRWCWR